MKSDIAAAVLLERIVRDSYGSKRSSEIQPLQWSILRFLQQAQDGGSNLSTITQHLGLTLSPVSRAVQTLCKRGLVSKRVNPKNAREVIVTLTEDGVDTLAEDPLLNIARGLRRLPEGQRAQFIRAIRDLAGCDQLRRPALRSRDRSAG